MSACSPCDSNFFLCFLVNVPNWSFIILLCVSFIFTRKSSRSDDSDNVCFTIDFGTFLKNGFNNALNFDGFLSNSWNIDNCLIESPSFFPNLLLSVLSITPLRRLIVSSSSFDKPSTIWVFCLSDLNFRLYIWKIFVLAFSDNFKNPEFFGSLNAIS